MTAPPHGAVLVGPHPAVVLGSSGALLEVSTVSWGRQETGLGRLVKHPGVGKVNEKDFILSPQTPCVKHRFAATPRSARLWSHPEGQQE